MPTYTINRESLKAVFPFVSTEETRYYLNGVFFTEGLLVAMDGRVMAVVKPTGAVGGAEDFILPSAVIRAVLQVKPHKTKMPVFVEIDDEKKTVSVLHQFEDDPDLILASIPYKPVEGTFPDWRRVFPAYGKGCTYQGRATSFNLKYLALFQSFGDLVAFYPNIDPEGPMLVRAMTKDFDAVGLIMPWRHSEPESGVVPEWIVRPAARSS